MSLGDVISRLYCSPVASPVGQVAVRCALAFAIAWIGALKFSTYDAKSMLPLMTSSPLMSGVQNVFSVTAN